MEVSRLQEINDQRKYIENIENLRIQIMKTFKKAEDVMKVCTVVGEILNKERELFQKM